MTNTGQSHGGKAAKATNPAEPAIAPSMRMFTIGDLAREFGVSLRALRFYEDRGLIKPQRRGAARIYNTRDKLRLQMILKGKELGFTLSEIHEMLQVGHGAEQGPLVLTLKPDQILNQIDHLQSQRSEIDHAIDQLRMTHRHLAEHAPLGSPMVLETF